MAPPIGLSGLVLFVAGCRWQVGGSRWQVAGSVHGACMEQAWSPAGSGGGVEEILTEEKE